MAVKYKEFENYEIDWLRFNTDLRALAEKLEDEGMEDNLHGGRYDYLRVKALAACYELWNYSAGVIVENEELWDKASDEAWEEAQRMVEQGTCEATFPEEFVRTLLQGNGSCE